MSEQSGRSRRKLHSRKRKIKWLPTAVLCLAAAAAVFFVLFSGDRRILSEAGKFLPGSGAVQTQDASGKDASGAGNAEKTENAGPEYKPDRDTEDGKNPETGSDKTTGTETGAEAEAESGVQSQNEEEPEIQLQPETEPAGEAETETEEETEPAPKYTENDNTRMIETSEEGVITMRFAGDILFDDRYAIMASMLERTGRSPRVEAAFDSGILGMMRGADIFMLNNEFPYSRQGAPLEGKKFTFRANPDYAHLLWDMGADIVGLANNHVNDYGPKAMQETFETLEGIGMPFVGAGRNLADASRPFYFTNGQVKIGIVAATQIERMGNPDTVGATDERAGVFRCYQPDRLLEQIRKMKEECDAVVAFVHWGTESTNQIDSWQEKQAVQIADAGADLIIGAHPHVLQKIGYAGNASIPVFYSLGNYLFSSKTLDTGLAEARFDASTGALLSVRFIPALQSGCRTSLLEGNEKQRVLQFMQSLSGGVQIGEDGSVSRK